MLNVFVDPRENEAMVRVCVVADHFQVLVGDAERGPRVDTSQIWECDASVPFVDGSPELIALPIVRFGGLVDIDIDVRSDPVEAVDEGWSAIGSFVLHVPSGVLMLWGPELVDLENAARVSVPEGMYRGQALACHLDEMVDENATVGPDIYRLVVWPDLCASD